MARRKKSNPQNWKNCPIDGSPLDRWGGCTKKGCNYMTKRWYEQDPKEQRRECGRVLPRLAEEDLSNA